MNTKFVKLFLRLALSASYLSAVADRFGFWPKEQSVWGNWLKFVEYTKTLNFWLPNHFITPAAVLSTAAEIIIPIFLLLGFKTRLFANLSGLLLLTFALAMCIALGIKAAMDYSVFTGAAASFALANMKEKFLELDR